MTRIVVLGGGYAGLACLSELAKNGQELDLHLVDESPLHYKITNLHKTFRTQVGKFTVRYDRLAEKFGFTFHRQHLPISVATLSLWQAEKKLRLDQRELPFDALVISTGAIPVKLDGAEHLPGLNSLRRGEGPRLLQSLIETAGEEQLSVSLVGGGATGIQVLFELAEQLRKERIANRLRLVDVQPRLVPGLPEGVHRYIVRKLRRSGIDYLPETRFVGQQGQRIGLEELATGRSYQLPSELTLMFPGVVPTPWSLPANPFGQVMVDGELLPDIFSAGDCSEFDSPGLNLLTAQAAVRKGKLVAGNIIRLSRGRSLQRYRYQEKGYLISLGSIDAVGWLGLRCNLVSGFPASVIKDAMETQYDLFLDGVDTYFDFPLSPWSLLRL